TREQCTMQLLHQVQQRMLKCSELGVN
ncbi:hypothetical protein A2U01_0082353, partial [Trifolium medium]|nr:hypothetical protein [Trifolium medium]